MYSWLLPYREQLPSDRRVWPQALLLAGSANLGGLALAEHCAAFLLCHHPAESSACGQCQSCTWFQAGHHPDLLRISKEPDEKVIKIDVIRDKIARLSKTAHSEAAQVVLIYPAENLNKAAANALLKSLEEPKAGVYFFLVADHHASLPKTVLSRCQIIRLKASNALAEKENDDTVDAWLEDCIAVALAQQNALAVAQKWASLLKEKELCAILYLMQDLARYQLTRQHTFAVYEARKNQIEQLAARFSLAKSVALCQSLSTLYAETIQGLNLNFQLSLECRLLDFAG